MEPGRDGAPAARRARLAGGHYIAPSTKFTNTGSVPAAASNPALAGNGGDAGDGAFVPNLFFATNAAFEFGL